MPTWLAIVIGGFVVLVVVLAAAGIWIAGRRQREHETSFEEHVLEANRALANAHAEDRGWDPATVEGTARRVFAAERPGVEVREIALVQVIDKPGTDEDKAVFRVHTPDGTQELVRLGRRDGEWVLEAVDRE
jgi:hypothetical protein